MKDYSKMSDEEINEAVYTLLVSDDSYPKELAYKVYHLLADKPDYCNNPSDAWPIIIANKIRISPVMHMSDDNGEYLCNGEWEAGTLWSEEGAFYNSEYHCFSDENALRAAMIVYLMMKDEEK